MLNWAADVIDAARAMADENANRSEFEDTFNIRRAILRSLDISAMRSELPYSARFSDDSVILAAMHKCRYEDSYFTVAERLASRDWLESRGYHPLHDDTWPADRMDLPV
jgi:hypothetical protein